MTLSELKNQVNALTGVTDGDTLAAVIQGAASEIWDSVDLPNTLQEIHVTTNSERYITFPWEVYKIRGVKSANERYVIELNSIHPYYQDYNFYQSEYICRVIRHVPIYNKITNASSLKFKARANVTEDITLTITGEIDNASYCVEPLVLTSGSREVISVENYVNIPRAIVKDKRTAVDIDIYDASGNLLGVFPNHLLESRYIMAQMYDRCTTIASPFSGCFHVLFKPHPPQLSADHDTFPDPFSQVVVFKATERLFLRDSGNLEVASLYNEKALALLNQFTADDTRGKMIHPSRKEDKLTSKYHGYL